MLFLIISLVYRVGRSYNWQYSRFWICLSWFESRLPANFLKQDYSNCSTTISGLEPSRNGGPQVPAPLEVKTCILPIWLRP